MSLPILAGTYKDTKLSYGLTSLGPFERKMVIFQAIRSIMAEPQDCMAAFGFRK